MANVNVKVGYTIDKSGLNEIKKQLADIRVEAKTADVLGNLTPQLKEAGQAAAKLEDILNSAWNSKIGQLDMGKVNNEIIKTWKSADNLGKALINGGKNGAIAFSSFASTILNSNIQLKQSSQLLDKMAITLKNTIRYGISSSIFNNLTSSIRKAYDYTVKLDSSLNDIRIVTGKSADEMDRFAQRANQVAKDLGRSTKDFTEAALIYYQQGLGNEEAQARAEITMKAANVTGQSGKEVSEQLTAVWNGYQATAENAEEYVDKLAAVAASTAADLEELSTGMSKVASAAKLMGVDIDQLNAQLATIVSVTRQAPESVGVALKTIYARMSDIKSGLDDETTLGNYTEKMAQYGINVLDANNNLRNMGDVIEEIGNKWDTLSKNQRVALAQTMAGTRQYNNLLSLFDNWDMYMDALDTSKNSLGELQREQDIYMESTKAHLEQLATEAEKTYSILFDQDNIRGFIDIMNDALSLLNTYLRGLGGGMQTITTLGLQVANVFSNQISGSISRQVENRRIEKNNENVDLLRSNFIQSYGMSDTYDQLDIPQKKRVDTEVEYAQKIGKIRDVLTEKEAQQLTEQQRQTAELTEQLEIYKQIRQEIVETLKLTEDDDFAEVLTNSLDESVDKIDRINQKLADTEKETKKLEQQQIKLNNKKEKTGSLTENEEKQLQKINDALDDQKTLEGNFTDELKQEKRHYDELNNLNQKRKGITDETIDNAKRERDAINNSIDRTVRLKEEQQSINNVLKGTTTILSLITSSIGIIKTLNDDNLSEWEKISSVMTVLGTQAVMLAMNYSSLKTMISDVVKLLKLETVIDAAKNNVLKERNALETGYVLTKGEELKITIAAIIEKLKEIATQTALNAATKIGIVLTTILNALTGNLGPIIQIVAIAIAALTAAMGAWAIQIISAEAEEKRLNKALQETKEEAQNAANAYNELKDTISKYKDTKKAIDSLKEGTLEFYEAISNANEEAKKLIETLNLQAGSQYQIDSNGLISISEDTLEKSLFKKNQEWFAAQLNQSLAERDLNNSKKDKEIARLTKGFQSGVNEKIKNTGYGITFEQAEKMIDAFSLNSEDLTISIGELQDTTNKNITDLKSKMGTFNQEELSQIETDFGSMSVLITDEMAKVISTIKEKEAEDKNAYKLIGSEAIKAFGTQEQQELLKYLPEEVLNTINETSGFEIATNREARISAGIGGRNITNTWEQMLGLWSQSPLSFLTPGASLIGNKIVKDQQNYSETLATNQKIIEDNLSSWIDNMQKYLIQASNAGFSEKGGGQYIAKAQFEAEQGKVDTSSLSQMTKTELEFLSNTQAASAINDILAKTGENLDTYIQKAEEAAVATDEWGRSQERISIDLENYNNELKNSAEELKTTTKAMQLYGEAAENAGKVNSKRDASTANEIKNLAKFNKAYNEAIKIYNDNKDALNEYVDAMKNNKLMSWEAAEATGEIAEQLESMGLSLTGAQLTENIEQVNKLLSGTEEEAQAAYNELLKVARLNAFEQLGIDISSFQDEFINFVNHLNEVQPGLEIEPEYIASLNRMIEASHMTAEQIHALLDNLHIQGPNMDVELEKHRELIHGGYTQMIKYDAEIPIMSGFGKEPQVKRMTFRIFKDVPAEYAEYYTLGEGQSLTTGGSPNFSRAPSNAGSGSGGGKSGGGGGGGGNAKEPDTMDPVDKEIDRYHDVDIQLKQIEIDLDKLDKQKKKLFGQDLIDNLNKQLQKLDKQINTTNEKIKIAQTETQELKNKLSSKGITFNTDGTIANYAQAYAAQLNYVNSLINQYNSMGAEAQESFKDTIEKAKEDFDTFTKNIDRYDELITDMIPGLEEDIQSAIDEKIDLQIEKFDMEIEIRLDLAEAERDWNEFKKKIIDDIKDDDILGNAMAKLVDFSSYYKEDNTGIVQALRKQVDNTLAELNAMDTNGWSQVYGDNRTAALEDLQKYYKELMSNLENVLELQQEIHESYMDMMDEAQEKFDEQIDSYKMISDLIDHDMQVISLVYGEEAYGQLARYYDKQQQNFNSQLDFQRQQVNFWRQQLDALEEGSDEWENAKEKWEDAVGEMNSLIEDSIQNLQDKYLNAINLIFQNLNNKITDGLGLDYIEEEWNLINKNADQYLDTINSLYETQKLESKYLDALDQTDSISAQRQLKKIMDEELADLRERDKLTQYDIERANKKYEIALKQIALQEAQQNKSKMRLRRDSQGNYRYEYTSDTDQIGQLQDELNDLYNSLYNFDKARYQENLNQMYDVWVEFQEKMAEAAQINDPVMRSERELLLQTQYEQLINGLTEQNTTVRNNLHESAFDDLAKLYDVDVSNFQNMSDEEKDVLMGDLIPYWESGVQHMTDVFAGDGGFIGVCKDAFEQLHDATRGYQDGLDELEVTGRIDFESIREGIDEDIERTQQLITDNAELINSYEQELAAIGNVIAQLDDLVNKYNEAKKAAIEATEAAYKYWSEQQRQAAAAASSQNGGSGSGNNSSNSGSSSSGGKSSGSGSGDGNLVVGDTATLSGSYYYDSYGTSPTGSKYSGVANGVVVDRVTNNPYGIHIHSADGRYPDLGWVKRSQLSGYDTGGYTGEWGSDGRLALLHQKELVLNKEDTANMLNAISIIRNITNMLGSSVLGKLAAATAGSIGTDVGGDVLEQNVHIDAQFPNVKDSREIEEALNNLVNMASMRANRR